MRAHLRIFFLAVLICASTFPAHAVEPIETDGPDFVDSSEAVGKDRLQIEADFVSERSGRDGALRRSVSTPMLARYGISENFELRVDGTLQVHETTRDGGIDSTASGHGDISLGFKWHTQDRDQATNTPAVCWIFDLNTPTGSENFRGHGLRPGLRSVITWDLPDDFSLGAMPGVIHDSRADGQRFTSAILGIILGKRLSERFRVFVESASSQIAHAEDGGVVSAWDVGAGYLLTKDVQIASRFAVGANRNSPAKTLIVELAVRF